MPRKAIQGRDVKGGMGQSLINKRKNAHFKKQASTQYAGVHVSDAAIDGGAGRLTSVTDRHELDQFLCDALLKETEFEVQHSSTVILTSEAVIKPKGDHQLFEYETVPIPRRPYWDENTTHEELDRAEREAFMKWRRNLATMEESLSEERQLTPFEKNLEVWKQLWRVLERSHIVVQILDARNPLLFRSKDMEAYVKEISDKKTLLLVINKADYLTPLARKMWADYFTQNKIDFVFWSAALEQQRLDDLERKRRRKEDLKNYHGHNVDRFDDGKLRGADSDDEEETNNKRATKKAVESEDGEEEDDDVDVLYEADDGVEEDDDDGKTILRASTLWKTQAEADTATAMAKMSLHQQPSSAPTASSSSSSSSSSPPVTATLASHQILTRDALFAYIIAKFVNSSPENKAYYEAGERITVGMTGYPNVGKSSTINVLAGAKKVTVGATPGKTKHFQTINVTDQITLCDCPGLVFPTFLSSRAELVCNGIMPIDQIVGVGGYNAPVQLVCEKVSRAQIQQTYSLIFPPYKDVGFEELLNSYARMRSFYKDHGRPDDAHAARIILKDFCAGKLLYCHPPPNISFDERRAFYTSFNVNGAVLIHESLWTSEEDLLAFREAQIAKSIEDLGAPSKKEEEVGIVGQRQLPVATKKKPVQAKKTNANPFAELKEDNENDDDDDDHDDDDDDDDDEVEDSGVHGADNTAARSSRSTVNQLVYNALMRDDMENVVLPTSHTREAAKLLEAGFNPDGTPLTKKQIQRLNQRDKNRKKTGKAHKLRKNDVPMSEVGFRTGGKSADSAARLGIFHG